jgi:hypothetical protein
MSYIILPTRHSMFATKVYILGTIKISKSVCQAKVFFSRLSITFERVEFFTSLFRVVRVVHTVPNAQFC